MKLPNTRLFALVTALVAGCGSSEDLGSPAGAVQPAAEETQAAAAVCKPDYAAAQRTAALALTGQLPAWSDLKAMLDAETAGADAQKVVYESFIDKAMTSKEFAIEQVRFFRNMFATANYAGMRRQNNNDMPQYMPDLNCAANYAASLVVNDQPYTYLFTAGSGTCPTFDDATGTFTPGEVLDDAGNAVPMVGVLNDPGVMMNYASNMAFRRVRFVQETFACNKFPAEANGTPTPMGAALYTSPWKFEGLRGGDTAKVNFQDTSAVVCANCHQTMNHLAPLFTNYRLNNGLLADTVQVRIPVMGNPAATLADFLNPGEELSWRFGKPTPTLAALGTTLAADPEVAGCIVNREWDHAFSRGDIVRDLATIPADTTASQVKAFTENQYNLKKLIRSIFVSNEYVSR